MLDGRWRAKAEHSLEPVGRALHLAGISADLLTVLGLLASIGTAVLIANGNLALSVIGLVLTGLPDILDGSVARHSGTAGVRGAFFDSVCDRVADAVLLGGVAWHLTDKGPEAPGAPRAARRRARLRRPRPDALGHARPHGHHRRAPLRDGVASSDTSREQAVARQPPTPRHEGSCPTQPAARPISRTGPALR